MEHPKKIEKIFKVLETTVTDSFTHLITISFVGEEAVFSSNYRRFWRWMMTADRKIKMKRDVFFNQFTVCQIAV